MLCFETGRNARQGGADLIISLTPQEAGALGPEGSILPDWFDTALWALALLRLGVTGAGTVPTAAEWRTVISDLDCRLLPRLEGIRDAAILAHDDAGGSVGELAMAMDAARSTAQYRRDVLRNSEPSVWESWARGEQAR